MELGSEGDKAPRVRIAHPMTAMKSEGTRKRRRAAMGDFTCSVGDKVDAWMRDRFAISFWILIVYLVMLLRWYILDTSFVFFFLFPIRQYFEFLLF